MVHLTERKQTTEGYGYTVHLLWNHQPETLQITPDRVEINWPNGTSVSNLVPRRLFPGNSRLTGEQIGHIVKVMENSGFEGGV